MPVVLVQPASNHYSGHLNHGATKLLRLLLRRNPRGPGRILLQAVEESADPRPFPGGKHAGGDALLKVLSSGAPVPLRQAPQADEEVSIAQLRASFACGLQQLIGGDPAAVVVQALEPPAVAPIRECLLANLQKSLACFLGLPQEQEDHRRGELP